MKLLIFGRFSKIIQISDFIKFRLVEDELFNVERRMDMAELIVAFTIYPEAPKMAMYRQQV